MSVNTVTLTGNLTRDPEVRAAGTSQILSFSIAVNERVKKGSEWVDEPMFFDVIVWGARGESLSRFLSKGMKVAVSGKLKWSQWNAQDGSKRSKIEIVASEVDLMQQRGTQGNTERSSGTSEQAFTDDIPFF